MNDSIDPSEGPDTCGGLFVEGCQSELQNQAVCQKILEVIKDLPEGEKLLIDALRNGRIGIKVVQNPTAEDDVWIHAGAAWDPQNRQILILFRDDLNLIISGEVNRFSFASRKRFNFFSDIVFELCNAANPLLQETRSPLLFPNRDLFARDIEFKEFKTYQRLANLRNYLSYKYFGIVGIEEQYTDDQFEKYLFKKKVCQKLQPPKFLAYLFFKKVHHMPDHIEKCGMISISNAKN